MNIEQELPVAAHFGGFVRSTRLSQGLTVEALSQRISNRGVARRAKQLERLEAENVASPELQAKVIAALGLAGRHVRQAAAEASVWHEVGVRALESSTIREISGRFTTVVYDRAKCDPEEERRLLGEHLSLLEDARERFPSHLEIALCRPCDAVVCIDPEGLEGWPAVVPQSRDRSVARRSVRRELDLSTLARLWHSGALRIPAASGDGSLLVLRAVGHRQADLLVVEGIHEVTRRWERLTIRGERARAWLVALEKALSTCPRDQLDELWRREWWRSRNEMRPSGDEARDRFLATPVTSAAWTEPCADELGLELLSAERWAQLRELLDSYRGDSLAICLAYRGYRGYRQFEAELDQLPKLHALDLRDAIRACLAATEAPET